jgi:hypothetical protein
VTLLSFGQLLELGYEPVLKGGGGYLLTPQGARIALRRSSPQNSWELPEENGWAEVPGRAEMGAGMGSWDHQPPTKVATSCNPFDVLGLAGTEEEEEEEALGEKSATPGEKSRASAKDHSLVAEWHSKMAHCSTRKLLKMARSRQLPDMPLTFHPLAIKSFTCSHCARMRARLPCQRLAKPRRGPFGVGSEALAGEYWHVDWGGKQHIAPGLGDVVDNLIITDDFSGGRFVFQCKDKTAATVLRAFKRQKAAQDAVNSARVAHIRMDGEYNCEEINAWCADNNIHPDFSPPHEPQSNGRAEASVGVVQSLGRTYRTEAGHGLRFRFYAQEYAALVSNTVSSDADPDGAGRSPLELWPRMPWQHAGMKLPPYGCRAYLHLTDPSDKTNGPRAYAGVFIGLSKFSASYILYDHETNKTHEGSNMRFDECNFPLLDLLRAGEVHPSDKTLDVDGWRSPAMLKIGEATDEQLAAFCTGKQVEVDMPDTWRPHLAPGYWTVRVHALVRRRDQDKTLAVEVECMKFSSDEILSTAGSPAEGKYKLKPLTEQLQVSKPLTLSKWAALGRGTTLRQVLHVNFPRAVILADYATMSVEKRGGGVPQHPAVSDVGEPVQPRAEATNPPGAPSTRALPRRNVARGRAATPLTETQHLAPSRTAGARRLPQVKTPARGTHFTQRGPDAVPRNYKEALASEDWRAADARELQGLYERGGVVDIDISEVPAGHQILPCLMQRNIKLGAQPGKQKFKSRCVIDGSRQSPKPPRSETYSSTPHSNAVRLLHALGCQDGHTFRQGDVSQAFLQSTPFLPHEVLYAYPPSGHRHNGNHVWRVLKPVYGLGVAPARWLATLSSFLLEHGWRKAGDEDTFWVYERGDVLMRAVFWVDDWQMSTNDEATADWWMKTLFERFDGHEVSPDTFLGLQIDYDRAKGTLKMHQSNYIEELLRTHQMEECNPTATPMEPHTHLLAEHRPATPDLSRRVRYQELVGSFQYLAQWTRPELGFVCSQLAKHLSNPGEVHWTAAVRVLRYLRGTPSKGITYTRCASNGNIMEGFVDADWASDADSRRSIGGYVFMINGGAVSWKAKQQNCIAHSSAEGEFMAASKASLEAIWLRRLLKSCGAPQPRATTLYEDNRACQLMSESPAHRERSKHIDLRVYSLKEQVKNGVVRLFECPTTCMTADVFTKSLPGPKFIEHREVLLGNALPTAPRALRAAAALLS